MRELRHDFRAYYGASYDDVPAGEAVDLILSLPPGSAYKAAASPALAWSDAKHWMADVMDLLLIVNWRLMGCPVELKPAPVERPGDAELRIRAREKAREAREKIEGTEWEEA